MLKLEAIGNLGDDAKLKVVGDSDVLNFRMAAKGSRKDSESQWLSCALWGTRASKLAEYMRKGQKIYIRGEAKVRQWESNGKSGIDVDVTVDELELVGDKRDAGDANERRSETRAPF